MIPLKIKEHLNNYIHQEVYVQIAVIKGKDKVSTKVAIESYFNSNHFRDLSEGRPYDHFIAVSYTHLTLPTTPYV